MQNKRKGFTLVELIVVLTILAILAALMIPALTGYIEKSLETSDIINVRDAYRDVLAAGIQGDTENWKGIPVAGGTCTVSYKESVGVVFNWSGKGTADGNGGSGDQINFDENIHEMIDESGVLKGLSQFFEIDSTCPNGTLVQKVKGMIKDDSLLKYGTWSYLGNTSQGDGSRYLFWTSVNTTDIGEGKKIPVIVSGVDGNYYISETTTATKKNNGQSYVTITSPIYNKHGFKKYTNGTSYSSLEEAYTAYTKLFADGKYPEYKDTLPK